MSQDPIKLSALRLQDLVDVSVLQHIQDWFVLTTGIHALIRDADGAPITRPTLGSGFCAAVLSTPKGRERCRRSNVLAVRKAGRTKQPVKYVCHAGLSQYFAPIEVHGRYLGSVVLGDRPEKPLNPAAVDKLARAIGLEPDQLRQVAAATPLWSEEQMRSSIKFLQVLANMLVGMAYQGYELRQTVNEMKALLDVTRMLTSTLDLQQVLNLIVRKVTEVLGVKACSLRLLDPTGAELVIKAVHNLSPRYLSKGPVLLSRSEIDRKALEGEAVYVPDMRKDPRILYSKEAEREGLRSSLAVAVRFQDKPIGVLHIYTAEPHSFSESEIALFRALADAAAVAIENARLYQESLEKRYMDNELSIAASIQSRLLPASAPTLKGFDIDARSVQSKRVGGDFYDFIPIGDGSLGVAVGDVSGKGVPGALLMASTRSALRALVESGVRPEEVMRRLNLSLCRDTGSDEFVSGCFGVLDAANRTFTYTNAGHNKPILVRQGQIRLLEKGGMVLGVSESARFEHESVPLQRGDTLVLYTDGVTDARNRSDELFGEERLHRILQRLDHLTAGQTVETIHLEVEDFSDGVPQFDDRTVMAIKVK